MYNSRIYVINVEEKVDLICLGKVCVILECKVWMEVKNMV